MDYRKLLSRAYLEATYSPDPSNQNGALLVDDDGKILAASCNHIPFKGGPELAAILADRDEKMKHIVHAEEGVIVRAAAAGIKTDGLTMICPWAACMPCARIILTSRVKRLVVHQGRMDTTPGRWKSEVDKALAWLTDAGVEVVYVAGNLPEAPAITVNGATWQP